MDFSIDSIPVMSTMLAQGEVLSKVGVNVLDTTLDVASTQMDGLAKMMELSVNPNLGANFDVSV